MRLFTSRSPRVVGRQALLQDALDDFVHTLPRQAPWLLARYEALLGEFDCFLEAKLGRPVLLNEVTQSQVDAWLGALPKEQREFAKRAVQDLEAYLLAWGWVERSPLQAA